MPSTPVNLPTRDTRNRFPNTRRGRRAGRNALRSDLLPNRQRSGGEIAQRLVLGWAELVYANQKARKIWRGFELVIITGN